MREKNIKLIMELIFIFILPICLLCFSTTITCDNNFTYDSNGNYEISSNLKKLTFNNSFIKYTNGYKNVINNFNIWDEEWEVLNTNFVFSKNYISVLPNTTYYYKNSSERTSTLYFYDENNVLISQDNFATNNTFITPNNCHYIKFSYQGTIYNHDICINLYVDWANGNYVPYGEPLILYTLTDVSSQNDINYTIWGKIKNLLIDNLSINDSVILDIILCYTMLWFIMFVIWHFFYLFFDGLIHLFIDWKKRSE